MPLHGEKGGRLCCLICRGAWDAKYGKLTRIERVLQRVLRSFYAAGGTDNRLLQLKVTTWLDNRGPGMNELTSDLLIDALSLVHPDRHPPERQLAERVTARLSELRPFVPEPEPEPEPKPKVKPEPADDKLQKDFDRIAKKQRFPCFDCLDHVPFDYCDACRQEWKRRHQTQLDHEAELRRESRRRSRQARQGVCQSCGALFFGRRADTKFCSDTCRQRAHRGQTDEENPAS